MEHNNWNELREAYESVSMSEEQVQGMKEKIEKGKKEQRRRKGFVRTMKYVAAAAVVFVILPNTSAGVAHAMSNIPVVGKLVDAVTFRSYQYEDERHNANVETPELIIQEKEGTDGKNGEPEQKEALQKTTEEINQEIKAITDRLVQEFEENLKFREGYQDIVVKHEVIRSGETYFTLKLICYQAAGSGAETDYFYTIDLRSGERVALKDLFMEGADYSGVIDGEIRKQMREQMDADENVVYWLDNEDIPEWNFRGITEDTSFYINQDNQVVIAFNEGDVAPMYMGCVEFMIPEEILEGIRK